MKKKSIFDITDQDKILHQKFTHLINFDYPYEREIVEKWWDNFVVKDGIDKTINEFQTTFHSVFWELYLNEIFLTTGYTLEDTESPDFIVNTANQTICIEARVANIADHSKPESERTFQDVFGDNSLEEITNELITRSLSAFDDKNKKYIKEYSKKQIVSTNPFVIAIADYGHINYGQGFIYPMLHLLYSAFYDPLEKLSDLSIFCKDNYNRSYKYKKDHVKNNGALLKMGLFNTDEYKHVSAILYTNTLALGKLTSLSENHAYDRCIVIERDMINIEQGKDEVIELLRYSGEKSRETLEDGLFVFHNPYADKPLNDNFLDSDNITHIRYDKKSHIMISQYPPLRRRKVCFKQDQHIDIHNLKDFKDCGDGLRINLTHK